MADTTHPLLASLDSTWNTLCGYCSTGNNTPERNADRKTAYDILARMKDNTATTEDDFNAKQIIERNAATVAATVTESKPMTRIDKATVQAPTTADLLARRLESQRLQRRDEQRAGGCR